ncbi:hypothetical protein J4N45_10070 [Vibrio sp. SCSIO 43140]|uniref:hypothetical protein n=1 Tax=Vibrio sp. SCSIO 43140 TaxID=2819100 RepID=UPI0020750DEF|nr:hypothetical protein [Vibrio sp. SCSIO 43140]USD58875.1 hypothetical protein J4N45_10070 [Vibrio sp. SCSIO 43140]
MGFFSWKTADTRGSIWNKFTNKCRPVYLLQPDGKEPIFEPAYEGYGRFGGVDAHAWLALNNLPSIVTHSLASDEELRLLGIKLACGFSSVIINSVPFVLRSEESTLIALGLIDGSSRYVICETHQDVFNFNGEQMSVNEAKTKFGNLKIPVPELKRPLKFSFKDTAHYESLPASKDCPKQGYF